MAPGVREDWQAKGWHCWEYEPCLLKASNEFTAVNLVGMGCSPCSFCPRVANESQHPRATKLLRLQASVTRRAQQRITIMAKGAMDAKSASKLLYVLIRR